MKAIFLGRGLFVASGIFIAVITQTAFADNVPAARHGQSATARKAILKDGDDVANSTSVTKESELPRARLSSEAKPQGSEGDSSAVGDDKVNSTISTHGRHGRSVMARESILKD